MLRMAMCVALHSMYIRVHAVPGARRERVLRDDDTTFTISVKEPAERNMANTRIRAILAEIFAVPTGRVRLVTGHRAGSKMYSVDV